MVAQHILDSVFALPSAEQFGLYDQLRRRLREAVTTLTDEQRRLLEDEIDAFEADGDLGQPWDEVEAEIRSTLERP